MRIMSRGNTHKSKHTSVFYCGSNASEKCDEDSDAPYDDQEDCASLVNVTAQKSRHLLRAKAGHQRVDAQTQNQTTNELEGKTETTYREPNLPRDKRKQINICFRVEPVKIQKLVH